MEKFFYFLVLFFIFLFGASIGSFLNCLIYRLYHKKSILPRSFCPKCFHQLSWYDLFPLVSFIILGRRCRYCQEKISWQYFFVELITGFLFLLSFLNLLSKFYILDSNFYLFLARDWFFMATMIFVFIYDLKYMLIEDIIILPAIVIIFILDILAGMSFYSILLGAVVGWGIFFFQYFLTKKKGIGEGDLRLGILMGLMFGWPKILVAVFSAYMIGGFVALIFLVFKRKGLKSELPLGPFLAFGSLVAMLLGDQFLSLY
jgi:leader peptidase (prepilin peptidase) / N-methyltransferase